MKRAESSSPASGAVTPIGTGVEGFWQGLRAGARRCGTITRFDPTPFRSRIAAQVDDFHPTDHLEERQARRFDRYSQLAVAATRLAVEDAHLDLAREDPDRIGVMMGTALGGIGLRRGGSTPSTSRAASAAVDPVAGAVGVRRRVELQRRHRVRRHRAQLHQRDELRLRHHRHRRRVPRHPRGDADVMLAGRCRGAAGAALLRRLRHHPRDVHPQRRPRHGQPSLRRRTRRLRDGRGRRGAGAGGARRARSRAGPDLRRSAAATA